MTNNIPKTKEEALKAGAPRYFTGLKCKHGHLSERYSCNGVCVECKKIMAKDWALKNPEKVKASHEKYKSKNADRIKGNALKWRRKNPEYFILKLSILRVDPDWKGDMSDMEKAVGYSLIDLKKHIESMFKDGMSWENWGDWHVDHVIPISKMKLSSKSSIAEINALSNIQCLWAIENQRKHNKCNPEWEVK